MKISTNSAVPVYTVAGSSTARPLPDWLIRKRKRSLKRDPEFANRIELIQDFGFEEASSCVRVSEDGGWVMSTGTYKPQIHVHDLGQLSLAFARHTDTLNETFILLSRDYSKSLHLQSDRSLELHLPGGCHYKTRIPRYGRGLAYDRRATEALVPSVGINAEGFGEVFRLNLEQGRFMKGYEVDVGGDTSASLGQGPLQGGIDSGAVNVAAVAEESHNLLAFGTSLGTVEFWDSRSRNRVGVLSIPQSHVFDGGTAAVSALQFDHSGLGLATGSSDGIVNVYDLRSSMPLLNKDQGYGYPIQDLIFLESTSRTRSQTSEPKILSADKRIIKIWDRESGEPWTSVEPAVDLHHVEWCRDSGMLLTANEGAQQHSFFIPQLGPAPKWCAFLDNLVEEMAEDSHDPNAYGNRKPGEVYDNYKFLTPQQLRSLNMDHLVGKTALLRPYMHGFFVQQKLYEEAVLINNPTVWEEQAARSIKQKIDKERESRIRGNKKVAVKVNRKLAEKLLERDEKHERKKAQRLLARQAEAEGRDGEMPEQAADTEDAKAAGQRKKSDILTDSRFARLFEEADFEIDETSREFAARNPSTIVAAGPAEEGHPPRLPRGLTAAEAEELEETRASDSSSGSSDSDEDQAQRRRAQEPFVNRSQRKKQPLPPRGTQMRVKASAEGAEKSSKAKRQREVPFGSLARKVTQPRHRETAAGSRAVGEKEISFVPRREEKAGRGKMDFDGADRGRNAKERRSASGNVFRRL